MEEKRVRLSGGELVYLEIGTGRPLVFFHGAFATPRAYIPLLSKLGQRFRVVAPTHPGHGDSFAADKHWDIGDYAHVCQEFLERLHLATPTLVGHSFGGTLALLLATGQKGKHVIAMDPAGLPFAITPAGWLQAKMHEARYLMDHIRDQEKLTQALSAAATLLYTARRHPEELSWIVETLPDLDLRATLATIAQPVHLLWGEDDGIVPVSIGKQMRAIIPHATLKILKASGHNYPVLEPDRTYGEIQALLAH